MIQWHSNDLYASSVLVQMALNESTWVHMRICLLWIISSFLTVYHLPEKLKFVFKYQSCYVTQLPSLFGCSQLGKKLTIALAQCFLYAKDAYLWLHVMPPMLKRMIVTILHYLSQLISFQFIGGLVLKDQFPVQSS